MSGEAGALRELELLERHLQNLKLTHNFLEGRLEEERRRVLEVQGQLRVGFFGPEISSGSSSTLSSSACRSSGRRTHDESSRRLEDVDDDDEDEYMERKRCARHHCSPATCVVVECSDGDDDDEYLDDTEVDLAPVTYRSCNFEDAIGEEDLLAAEGAMSALECGAPAPSEPALDVPPAAPAAPAEPALDFSALAAVVRALGALAQEGPSSEVAVEAQLAKLSVVLSGIPCR